MKWWYCAISLSNRSASITWRPSSAALMSAICPGDRVVGISKLARVVDGYARRFQVQEKLTAQIAGCINEVLKPRGWASSSTPFTNA